MACQLLSETNGLRSIGIVYQEIVVMRIRSVYNVTAANVKWQHEVEENPLPTSTATATREVHCFAGTRLPSLALARARWPGGDFAAKSLCNVQGAQTECFAELVKEEPKLHAPHADCRSPTESHVLHPNRTHGVGQSSVRRRSRVSHRMSGRMEELGDTQAEGGLPRKSQISLFYLPNLEHQLQRYWVS
jgi:hypothetical protein